MRSRKASGIKSPKIVGEYKKQGGKILGDFISNSNFGGFESWAMSLRR